IAVLYERWGTIPQFQRTRGVLRLLAFLVSDLYQGKDNEPVIQSGSVHLGSAELRGELVKLTGNNAFHAVIDSDIAGKQAKAPATTPFMRSSTATSPASRPRPRKSTVNWAASTPRSRFPRSWPAPPSFTRSAAGTRKGRPCPSCAWPS